MREIPFLLLAIWLLTAPVSILGQPLTFVHQWTTGGQSGAGALSVDPSTGYTWVAGTAGIKVLRPNGVVDFNIPLTGTLARGVDYSGADGFTWATIAAAPRLRAWDSAYAPAGSSSGVSNAYHIRYLADGSYVVVRRTPHGWDHFDTNDSLLRSGGGQINPFGVEVDGNSVWVSHPTLDRIYEYNLTTGLLVNTIVENNPTGLCFFEGVLHCVTSSGQFKAVGGATYLTGLGAVQDLEMGYDLLGRQILVITTASAVSYYIEASSLPIDLDSFEARLVGKNAVVEVITATEAKNRLMFLEHRTDNTTFEAIDSLPGGGTTTEKRYYRFEVAGLAVGANYFRLRQVDLDGTFTYSPIRVLTVEGEEVIAAIFPNPAPAGGEVTVVTSSEDATIEVVDLGGRILQTINVAGTTATLASLPAGSYFVRVIPAVGPVITKKLIVTQGA